MLLLAALVATATWSYGFAQKYPVQSPISITKSQRSARMTCEIQTSGEMFDSMPIHWYQQKEGRAPERLLHFSEGKAAVETGFVSNRYSVEKVSSQKRFIFTIKDVIPDDAATYYCAYWDTHHDRNSKIITAKRPPSTAVLQVSRNEGFMVAQRITIKDKGQAFTQSPGTDWEINGIFFSNGTAREHLNLLQRQNTVWSTWIKYFGMGTTLIISSKGNSPPANFEILQKEHENLITYVCLVEKFYPEVIRVTWTNETNEEVTGNVVKGDTWKATKNEEYSIGSWLTVPVEDKDKKYYCKYEHESQERSLPTQDSTKTAPQEEDCTWKGGLLSGNSTVFNRDHNIHRTAYLVYIVILLKSSMYYLIILFFIYRMWAATKHQGKKA